mmetsp:Transcript_34330/g.52607  ORF Transcript_34330/g.52607 Transcript_34330/m.52607 type:complete len:200 (+) Transcript_34330:379-978(+)
MTQGLALIAGPELNFFTDYALSLEALGLPIIAVDNAPGLGLLVRRFLIFLRFLGEHLDLGGFSPQRSDYLFSEAASLVHKEEPLWLRGFRRLRVWKELLLLGCLQSLDLDLPFLLPLWIEEYVVLGELLLLRHRSVLLGLLADTSHEAIPGQAVVVAAAAALIGLRAARWYAFKPILTAVLAVHAASRLLRFIFEKLLA